MILFSKLFFYFYFLVFQWASASAIPEPEITQANQLKSITQNGSVEGTIVAALSIAVGLFVAFTGYKLFKAALFIAGFIIFSDITLIIMTRVEPSGGYNNRDLLLFIIPAGLGLIGGLIAFRLWRMGLSFIGALGGACIGAILLNLGVKNAIQNDTSRLVFIIALAILGAIVIHFVEKVTIIASTALAGSYTTFIGLDIFIKTGFNSAVQKMLFVGADIETGVTGAEIGMVMGVLILFALACLYQFRTTKDHKHRDDY